MSNRPTPTIESNISRRFKEKTRAGNFHVKSICDSLENILEKREDGSLLWYDFYKYHPQGNRRVIYETLEDYINDWSELTLKQLKFLLKDVDHIMKLIHYSEEHPYTKAVRNREAVVKLHKENPHWIQEKIAAKVGISQRRVSQILEVNTAHTDKTSNQKRVQVRVYLNQGTKPSDAAQRIKDKFGKQFAKELCQELEIKIKKVKNESDKQ